MFILDKSQELTCAHHQFGHVDLPDYDHIIDSIIDLNEKEALLTEAWGNQRAGGFSKERHINLMKDVLGP